MRRWKDFFGRISIDNGQWTIDSRQPSHLKHAHIPPSPFRGGAGGEVQMDGRNTSVPAGSITLA